MRPQNSKLKSILGLGLKVGISVALLALVLSRVGLKEALTAAAGLTPAAGALATLVYFAAHAVNAAKLRVLLPGLSLWQAWRFTMIAVLFGTALPGQLAGDAVKAFRLARAAPDVGEVTAAVAAVAVDKIIGMFALLLLTALGLGLNAAIFGQPVVIAAGVVTVLIPVGLAVVLSAPLPAWLGKWGQEFAAWRTVALTRDALLRSLALGIVFQMLSIAAFVILGGALGITLSVTAWAVIVGLISVVLLVPVTVAGLGLREGSLVAVLAMLGEGTGPALALSFSLLALNLLGAGVGLVLDLTGRDKTPSA
jgi:uncharacterized membrane protein YbhN (UPF0104 family)